MEINKVLAIGGSDPSGGAGIQADIKTLVELGIYPYTALSAITAQNSSGVISFEMVSAKLLRDQIEGLLADGHIDGVKTGMLGTSENIMEVVHLVAEHMIEISVVDPLIRANNGKLLVSEASTAVLKKRLLPYCFMVTPNIYEAKYLTGVEINDERDFLEAAKVLKETGVEWVLIKGGHLSGDTAIDFLFNGKKEYFFEAKKARSENVRGTGCMLASAVCAYLVKGFDAYDSVKKAKAYVYNKIKSAVPLGRGSLQAVHPDIEHSGGDVIENQVNK